MVGEEEEMEGEEEEEEEEEMEGEKEEEARKGIRKPGSRRLVRSTTKRFGYHDR